MAHLSYPSPGELQLRLEAHEDAILSVVRGCPWWIRADVEGRTPGNSTVSSITLTATRGMDSTLRRILQMSFGLVFPKDGGVGERLTRELTGSAATKGQRSRKN